MTKKNKSSRVALYLTIGSLVFWLFSCSEEPNQSMDNAKTHVNEGGNESIGRQTQSIAQNDEALTDLIMAMQETKMALKESELLLARAPRGQDSNAPLMALERELRAAESLLIDVQRSIEQGDYLKAKAQIHKITGRTNQVNQQIRQMIGKPQRGG